MSRTIAVTVTPSNDPVTLADGSLAVAEVDVNTATQAQSPSVTVITAATVAAADPEVDIAHTQLSVQLVYSVTAADAGQRGRTGHADHGHGQAAVAASQPARARPSCRRRGPGGFVRRCGDGRGWQRRAHRAGHGEFSRPELQRAGVSAEQVVYTVLSLNDGPSDRWNGWLERWNGSQWVALYAFDSFTQANLDAGNGVTLDTKRLERMAMAEGVRVDEGTLLAELAATAQQQERDKAQALSAAYARAARGAVGMERDGAAQEALAEQQATRWEAQRRAHEAELQRLQLLPLEPGQVRDVDPVLKPGTWVGAAHPLATVVDGRRWRVEALESERERLRLAQQQPQVRSMTGRQSFAKVDLAQELCSLAGQERSRSRQGRRQHQGVPDRGRSDRRARQLLPDAAAGQGAFRHDGAAHTLSHQCQHGLHGADLGQHFKRDPAWREDLIEQPADGIRRIGQHHGVVPQGRKRNASRQLAVGWRHQ